MTLHHQIMGEGPPLIIVHGLFGCGDNWRRIAKSLSENYQVIAVDLRNHGRSFHHAQQNYSLMADDLRELMAERAIEQADFIGHSIGGKTVIQLAQDAPDCVNRMVIVDMAPGRDTDRHSKLFKNLLKLDLSHYQRRAEIDEAMQADIPEPAIRQFLLTNVERAASGFRWRVNLEGLFCAYPALLKSVIPQTPLSQPTLFMAGADSDYIKDADEKMIHEAFANVRIETIADAGHWIHAEQPAVFLETVGRFLDDD